jgi:hypothetical protein
MSASDGSDKLIRLARAARGLEAGGFNNGAKLLWGLLFAEEVRASNEQGVPRGAELDAELGAIAESLKADGVNPAVLTALENARAAVREERTIPHPDIPDVYVSRTSGEVFLSDPPAFTASNDHLLGLRKFPAIWYFDSLPPHEVLAALTAAPDLIESQLNGLSADQMNQSPVPGEWSVRELLGHLLMAQELLAVRVEKLLAEENPSLQGLAVWAMEQKPLSPSEILERYRASREHVVTRLKAIPFADWWRAGWHEEFARVTILDQATYFARHEMSHIPQFAQLHQFVGG